MASYGFGNTAKQPLPYSPEDARRRAEQEEQEAYSRWVQSQSLGLQLAGQKQQNLAQRVYNANTLAQAAQSAAASGYGLGRDRAGARLAVAAGETDLAQQAQANRRYGFGLRRDIAQQRSRPQPGYGSRAASLFRG